MSGSSEFTLTKSTAHDAPRPPRELGLLLDGAPAKRSGAWARFLSAYSQDIVQACRSVAHDHDTAMDHYAHVIEALQRDDYRRLRTYRPDGRTRFTTWLTVVARRLSVDHHRSTHGRSPADQGTEAQALRARLQTMKAEDVAVEDLPSGGRLPDSPAQANELTRIIAGAKDRLSAEDRALLALRFEDDAPVREIADILGMPSVFHVYRRLNKALRRMREELEREGVDGVEP